MRTVLSLLAKRALPWIERAMNRMSGQTKYTTSASAPIRSNWKAARHLALFSDV